MRFPNNLRLPVVVLFVCATLVAQAINLFPQFTFSPGMNRGMCLNTWRTVAWFWRGTEPPRLSDYGITLERTPLQVGGQSRIWVGTARRAWGRRQTVIVKEAAYGQEALLREEARIYQLAYGERSCKLIEAEGRVYLVFEFSPKSAAQPTVPAPTLHDVLYGANRPPEFTENPTQRRPDHLRRVEDQLLTQVEALHNHASRIVHGDLKPRNILISFDTDGNPVVHLIDFGVASTNGIHPPDTDQMYGTRGYMDYEAFTGNQITPARDVHALQRVLLELYAPEFFANIEQRGVRRHFIGADWWEAGRVLDHMPNVLPREVAMVLGSSIPTTIPMLRAMLAEARDPATFNERFAARWAASYEAANATQRRFLLYELLTAPNQGPEVFARLPNDTLKQIVVNEARRRELTVETEQQEILLWHPGTRPGLQAFLDSAPVRAFEGRSQ